MGRSSVTMTKMSRRRKRDAKISAEIRRYCISDISSFPQPDTVPCKKQSMLSLCSFLVLAFSWPFLPSTLFLRRNIQNPSHSKSTALSLPSSLSAMCLLIASFRKRSLVPVILLFTDLVYACSPPLPSQHDDRS